MSDRGKRETDIETEREIDRERERQRERDRETPPTYAPVCRPARLLQLSREHLCEQR